MCCGRIGVLRVWRNTATAKAHIESKSVQGSNQSLFAVKVFAQRAVFNQAHSGTTPNLAHANETTPAAHL
jgi:hypothetical protein